MLVLMGGMLVIIIAVVVVSAVTSVVSAVAASEDIDSVFNFFLYIFLSCSRIQKVRDV